MWLPFRRALVLLAISGPAALAASGRVFAPAAAQHASTAVARSATEVNNVRVTARIVVVDREAITRAGLQYVVADNDRVRVRSTRGALRGARVPVGTHGITAFLEALRESRWVRSESTQQVLTLSGSPAIVSSSQLAVARHGGARTRGPSLAVVPTVLADGTVRLQVSATMEDAVTSGWGYRVDGSPAIVDSEVIAREGQELILATSSTVQSSREAGLLRWGTGERGRDVLVAVRAEVVRP